MADYLDQNTRLNPITADLRMVGASTLPQAAGRDINNLWLYGTILEVPPDTTPPTIGAPFPLEGPISAGDDISLTVSGATKVWIFAEIDGAAPELVYNPETPGFTVGYSGGSVVGNVYTFGRDGDGWHDGFNVLVFASDAANNEADDTFSWTAPSIADVAPPIIGTPSPAEGAISTGAVISLTVTGATKVWLFAQFGAASPELIYNPETAAFTASYAAGSVVGGLYTFTRAGDGWYDDFEVLVFASDDAGNEASVGYSWTAPPLPDTSDTVDPVVGNISPAPWSSIEADTPLTFDVTDVGVGLGFVLLAASFRGLAGVEVVFANGEFTAPYEADSTVSLITDGLHFSLLRTGGWPAATSITPYAIDASGNVSD